MRMVQLSEVDVAQVHAILMTHAEMQDSRINQSMEIIGRLKRDEPDDEDAQDMIDDLTEQVEIFEKDCDNLKRIANLFV